MIRPILRHGASVLHRPAAPVPDVTPEVQQVIADMIDTMHAAPGVGLAAPQIGVAQRVLVIDLSVGARREELVVLVNPRFVLREGLQLEEEGCLSLPGLVASVARPRRAVVSGLDGEGRVHEVDGTGLLARALQHEMDHLEGRLYVDRLRGLRRWALLRRVAHLERRGRW